MIIVIKEALDGRSFPEAGDYVYNLMLPFQIQMRSSFWICRVCLIFRRCFLICA